MTKNIEPNKDESEDIQPVLATTRKFFAPTAGVTVEAKDVTAAAALVTKLKKQKTKITKDVEVGDDII